MQDMSKYFLEVESADQKPLSICTISTENEIVLHRMRIGKVEAPLTILYGEWKLYVTLQTDMNLHSADQGFQGFVKIFRFLGVRGFKFLGV